MSLSRLSVHRQRARRLYMFPVHRHNLNVQALTQKDHPQYPRSIVWRRDVIIRVHCCCAISSITNPRIIAAVICNHAVSKRSAVHRVATLFNRIGIFVPNANGIYGINSFQRLNTIYTPHPILWALRRAKHHHQPPPSLCSRFLRTNC